LKVEQMTCNRYTSPWRIGFFVLQPPGSQSVCNLQVIRAQPFLTTIVESPFIKVKPAAMGRRSLPKFDREFPIDSHFRELADMEPPWDAENYFDRSGPLEIEIGSGKGLFLLNSSGEHPDRLFLGVEVSKKYSRFAAYRMAKQERDNAKMIRGDAMQFMHEFVADDSVAAVHIYFPDPWWKEKHRPRRIVNPQVVGDIQRVLQPGGIFHFWTDVEEYFESAIEIIQANSDLQGPIEVAEQEAAHDMDFRTHFERRMRLNDHPVYRSRFLQQA